LRVNLLVNRASVWADVNSHLPFKGQVDVHVKKTTELFVRIPAWVQSPEVRCERNGQPASLVWQGRYVSPGRVLEHDLVTISFPLPETAVQARIGEEFSSLTLRGSTVVDISPRASRYRLYQRGAFRTSETRWKQTERFAPEIGLDW
jgi:hypothetical protein